MKEQMKQGLMPFLTLYIGAVVSAIVARVGIWVIDSTVGMSYNYRSATAPYTFGQGSKLDQLVYIFTGSTMGILVLAVGIAFGVGALSVLLYAKVYGKKPGSRSTKNTGGSYGAALLWALITIVVVLCCFIIVISGAFSGVQASQLASKAGGGPLGLILLLVVIALVTQVAAASCLLEGALSKKATPGKRLLRVSLIVFVASAIVAICGMGAFHAVNAETINAAAAAGFLIAGIVTNLALMYYGGRQAAAKK